MRHDRTIPRCRQANSTRLGLALSAMLHASFFILLAFIDAPLQTPVQPSQSVELVSVDVKLEPMPEARSGLSPSPSIPASPASGTASSGPSLKSAPKKSEKPRPTDIPPPKPRRPALVNHPVRQETPTSGLKPRTETPARDVAGEKPPSRSDRTARDETPPGFLGDAERRGTGTDRGGTVGRGQGGIRAGSGGSGSAGDSGVQVLSRTLPDYPGLARNRNIEGWVLIEITVDRNGLVTNPRVVGANPAGVFEQAAIDAVRKWRFKPARRQGISIEQRVKQKVVFHLR